MLSVFRIVAHGSGLCRKVNVTHKWSVDSDTDM